MKRVVSIRNLGLTLPLAAVSLSSQSMFGQGVIYNTPPQPINYSAGVVDSTTYIDVNNDGTPDFAIVSTTGFTASIAPLGNNSIAAIPEPPPDTGYFVTAFGQGAVIDSSLSAIPGAQWYNAQTDQYASALIGGQALFGSQLVVVGYFAGQPSAYAGFDLVYGGADHYGWLQLQNPLNIVNGQVVDWAYQSQANTPIGAGVVPEPSTWGLLMLGGITAALEFKVRYSKLKR